MLKGERTMNATEYAKLRGTALSAVKSAFQSGRLSAQLGANDGRSFAESTAESFGMRRERIAAQICAVEMSTNGSPLGELEDWMVEDAVRIADKLARKLHSLDKDDQADVKRRALPA